MAGMLRPSAPSTLALSSLLLAAACSDGTAARDEGSGLGTAVESAEPGAGAAASDELPAPSGTGPELIVSSGWVDGSTNAVGVQGAFFTYGDGSGRTSISENPGASQTGYCVAGSSAQVIGGDFGGTWGAVAALNLSQLPDDETARLYDAEQNGVAGFAFDIVGNTGGALRFVIKQFMVHDGFCINNVPSCETGCSVQYRVDELAQNCWTPGGPTPNARSLQALEWQITTREAGPIDFDYCIENIRAVLADAAPIQ
jgi:hypothetical protein